MENTIKDQLWRQFGATIDMFEQSIRAVPDDLWSDPQYWYRISHTLYFLDYYLTEDPKNYHPPPPFTMNDFQDEKKPDRIFPKEELLAYLEYSRQKCRDLISRFDEIHDKRFIDEYRDYPLFELMIYNLRHVEHHLAQINLLLRQNGREVPGWISRTKPALKK